MAKTNVNLIRAAQLMQEALEKSTGFTGLQQKLVIYWSLSTHCLRHLGTFPLLGVQGKMGTGKSQTLLVVGNFAHRPTRFSLRGMTGPAIRDKFAEAHERTAIVEEADDAWKDPEANFERLLSDRYQRATAEATHKVRSGESKWVPQVQPFFGATGLHRRMPFRDAALDARTIRARTQANHSRQYRPFEARDPWNEEGRRIVSELHFKPVEVEQPAGIAARVFDTYKPLLSTARICADELFHELLLSKLAQETLELKEAQASEPDGLVLQAVIERIWTEDGPAFKNIRLSDVSKCIYENHRISVLPRQIGSIARELGLATTKSHGTTVITPTVATLLKACSELDYTDDGIEELRQQMLLHEGVS